MIIWLMVTAPVYLFVSCQLTSVIFPQRPGTEHGLEWCSKGIGGAAIRAVQTLLSQKVPMSSALNLVALYESQFAPLTGQMILNARQWADLQCESDMHGSSRLTRAPETFFLFPVALGDLWCRTLEKEALQEEDAHRLLESQQEMAGLNPGALSEVINLVVTGSRPRPGVIMNDQTLLAVMKLLPIIQRLMSFEPDSPLGDRLRSFSAKACRLMDLEQMIPGLSEHTPITCTLNDLIMAGSACIPIKTDLKTIKELQEECRTFEEQWDNNKVIDSFPNSICYATRSVLQRKDQLRDKTLRAFYWTDPDLQMSLDLNVVIPQPDYHDLATRNSELLTYLAIYRAVTLFYRFSEVAWAACETKEFDKPRHFVPGWDLYHVILVALPMELDTRPESWRPGSPFVAANVNPNKPCEILFILRGTAFAFEWLLNFNWWSVPMPGIDAEIHSGYLAIWQTVVSTIQALVEARSEAGSCTCEDTRLIFAGHSMGASIAEIIALHLAHTYKTAGCNARVDAILLANPRSLSKEAREIYRQNVNGRNLIDLGDPIYSMPCYTGNSRKGMPRCSHSHFSFSGKGRDIFSDNIGSVLLDVDFHSRGVRAGDALDQLALDNMTEVGIEPRTRVRETTQVMSPFVANLLRTALSLVLPQGSLKGLPSKWEIVSAHVCSYACGLSIACHGLPWSEFKWWCNGMHAWGGHQGS